MKWRLLVRPEAERDLESARDWYDDKSPKLGDAFLDEVATGMEILAANPESQRLYHHNFRRLLLRRFPYKIFYQIIGERVVIFRVLHVRQCHAERLPD